LALFHALLQIVCQHWHAAALFLKLFAARRSASLRFGNIEIGDRN